MTKYLDKNGCDETGITNQKLEVKSECLILGCPQNVRNTQDSDCIIQLCKPNVRRIQDSQKFYLFLK